MSTTQKFDYKRWLLRGQSDLMSVTAMYAMTTLAYERMAAAEWTEAETQGSSLPPHHYTQSGFKPTYDAAKFCGDYATGQQIAYACAACYSIKLPPDACAGTKAKIEAVAATVHGDRWLSEGAVLSAFRSDSATPPAWEEIVAEDSPGRIATSPDPAPGIDEPTTPDWRPPLRRLVRNNATEDQSCDAVIAPAAPVEAKQWLHIVIRLSDYISVTRIPVYVWDAAARKWVALADEMQDNKWIEGGAAIDGPTIAITFDRAVAAPADSVLVAFHKNWGRTGYDIFNGPYGYDVDLSFRMNRQNDLLTGVKHYRSLLEQQRWPLAVLASVDTDMNGNVKNPYEARTVSTTNGLGRVGFYKSTSPEHVHCNYAMSWVLYGRSVLGRGKTVKGISFPDAAIASPTTGLTLRLSVFGSSSGYHITTTVNPGQSNEVTKTTPPQMISFDSVTDENLFLGKGDTTLKFVEAKNYGGTMYNLSQTNFGYYNIGASIPLELLAGVDVTSAIQQGEMVPFHAPYAVPDFAMIFCVLTVKEVADAYAVDMEMNDLVQWYPRDFNLHIIEENANT